MAADAVERPSRLSEVLPPAWRTDAELATELQRVQQLEARLAAYKAELVTSFAAHRPDSLDVPQGRPGAAVRKDGGDDVLGEWAFGTSEFVCDELAMVLRCSRTAASVLVEQSFTLLARLRATWAALADGRLDWPRARAIVAELGWPARDTDVRIVAQVEAAVLPHAAGLSVKALAALARRELISRDAAAAERRRKRAERLGDVKVRRLGDGVSELVTVYPHARAAEIRELADAHARLAKADGDPRPLGLLRAEALYQLITRPWDTSRQSVSAHVTVVAPLGSLRGRTADVSPGPGATPQPVPEVNGEPITAGALRSLLEEIDALCPGGLQPPTCGTLTLALADADGRLRATLHRRELEQLVRRGCPLHSGADCACPVLDRPPGVDRYRPTAAQRRFVKTRDRTCRHPGCTNRAGWADIDHVVAHSAGGETDCGNLCCLCRRHHRLKTHSPGWIYTMTDDGVLSVTTPSGVTRTSRPPGLLNGTLLPASGPDPGDNPPPF